MSALLVSIAALASMLGGILLAIFLRRALPQHHLNNDARDIVRLGSGLLGSLAALVLGLLVASANSSYDAQTSRVRQLAANLIQLDLMLEQYGPETREIRGLLRRDVEILVASMWRPSAAADDFSFRPIAEGQAAYGKLLELQSKTDVQRSLQTKVVQTFEDMSQARLSLHVQQRGALPKPFLIVLVFWLTIIFLSFILFAEPTLFVLVALAIFALSTTGAIYLILELSHPFDGLMQIPRELLGNSLRPMPSN